MTEIDKPQMTKTVISLTLGIAFILIFVSGFMIGEQRGYEKTKTLQFEVTNFADHQPVSSDMHKVGIDDTTIMFDMADPNYAEENITMIGIKVHPYPKEQITSEKSQKITSQIADTMAGTAKETTG